MSDRRLEIVKGDDIDIELTFTDQDDNPIDLTGGTVYFTVKKELTDDDDDAVIAKDVTAFENPETGIMVVSLSRADTDVRAGQYFFDAQLKDSEDKITSSPRGILIVTQGVTERDD